MKLAYLSLETPIKGQASYTHVHEIIAGLEALGWCITPYFASRSGASKGSSYGARLWDYVRVQWLLARRLSDYDVVFIRGHFAAFVIALVCRLRGIPIVHEINGTLSDIGVTYPWAKRILGILIACQRFQYRHASHLFAVTPQLSTWAMHESAHTRVTTVMNGVNTHLFTDDGERHFAPRPYVIFVGGLVKWHGIVTLLQALDDPHWPPNCDLMIVGDGVERALLTNNKNPRLIWHPHLPYADVPHKVRGALAGIIPIESPAGRSNYGVLPLKLFEAMACGIPVIATDLPAQRDIVKDDDAGTIIAPVNPQSLAQAVAFYETNPEIARIQGKNGAQAARLKHGWHLRAKQIDDVLRTIITKG